MKKIIVFDTTLRDGEQSPGCSMNMIEKSEVASQLEKMNVDVIEAGFAISSEDDFLSIQRIARSIKNASVCSLARCIKKDIDRAAEAVASAASPYIHVFLATSDIHMKYKLKMSPEQVIESIYDSVSYAKRFTSQIEFSAEDATRSDRDFLCLAARTAIEAGAIVVNIPDTVGYASPDEMFSLVRYVSENVPNIDRARISVHCHNDLGLAVANSLAAIKAGALQVETAINGIGERAGNAALEEIAMNLYSRRDEYNAYTDVKTTEIYRASKLVSMVTGTGISPTKPIIGGNAFRHEAGIHQHGVMENPLTYEILKPETIGLYTNNIILGKHSGRHAFEAKIKELGYENLPPELVEKLFEDFKNLADKKKDIHDRDIEALILKGKATSSEQNLTLKHFVITCGDKFTTIASVALKKGDNIIETVSDGDGPIDAAFKAIDKTVGYHFLLEEFNVSAVTGGRDAQGTAKVRLRYGERELSAVGISTDIIEASIFAYLNAINEILPELDSE